MNSTKPSLKPEATSAKRFWRSLEELAESPEFEAHLHEEFPRQASAFEDHADRRQFLQLMAASFALAGMNGCSRPPAEPIMPYVRTPPEMVPGLPRYFATAMPGVGGTLGLVVTSHMGRPVKVEGNPLHPASLGATDVFAQASVLTLYDPDRSQTVRKLGQISTWDAFLAEVNAFIRNQSDGAGLRILSQPIQSPTLERQRTALLERFPGARWYTYEPVNCDAAREAARQAFGEPAEAVYQFANAERVLAIDCDFLCCGPAAVRYARDFMSRRNTVGETPANRLYAIESSHTPTGAAADHRLPLAPSEIKAFVRTLAARWNIGAASATSPHQAWIDAIGAELEAHRGRSLVIAGDEQPAAVQALAVAINQALGNIGSTVKLIDATSQVSGPSHEALQQLSDELEAGQVQLLIVLDCNPAYDAPPALNFASKIAKAGLSVHWGLYDDETAGVCKWHVPAAHYLESWSDARAFDGTASIIQPLIAPLYDGKTAHELVSALVVGGPRSSYDLVRETWRTRFGDQFDAAWHQALADGVIADTAFEPRSIPYRADAVSELLAAPADASQSTPDGTVASNRDVFELVLRPDPCIGDGRFANNGWLQELPKPLTKLTWDNAVLMSPADAEKFGLATGDVVRLQANDGETTVSGPVFVMPGHASGCVTCHLGYGRTRAGRTGTGVGFNAYALISDSSAGARQRVSLTHTGAKHPLALTQSHFAIDDRHIVHSTSLEKFHEHEQANESLVHHHEQESFYPEIHYDGFAWGMSIDLSKCVGCNACVVACQAENNVPIVGREGVLRSREMHWLRIDTYYQGEPENPEAIQQPMLCQHCEKAPCEVVCPVAATTHSNEGLNEMTYNRCVGTRYCSNNCPYKVRRFNFLQYQDETTPVLKLLRNPNVTVRSRGVMEKCTYCVQRINTARIGAKKDAVDSGQLATIADGTLQTACQQACPTQAIIFGDINDTQSRVSKLKADVRDYSVLDELNTQPRTTYLVRVRNLNPALAQVLPLPASAH